MCYITTAPHFTSQNGYRTKRPAHHSHCHSAARISPPFLPFFPPPKPQPPSPSSRNPSNCTRPVLDFLSNSPLIPVFFVEINQQVFIHKARGISLRRKTHPYPATTSGALKTTSSKSTLLCTRIPSRPFRFPSLPPIEQHQH